MRKKILLPILISLILVLQLFTGCGTGMKSISSTPGMKCDEKADEALMDNRFEKSVILHEFFIKEHPENGLAMYHLGYSHGQLNDREKEMKYYEEAIRLGYYGSGIFFNLGMAYSEMEKYDDAVRIFKKAIEVEPESADNHFGLALTYEKMGDLAGAEKALITAAKLSPSDIDVNYFLGKLYLETGKKEEAFNQLEKLIKIAPDDEMTLDLQKALEEVSEDNTGN
ncbi:MAG: tetratricopeptide repeat protein [Deltaproteobacteria bacterium]|nr:tetratricopeptide repeat protein [Deltaproteobacteria bacterium]